MSLTRTPQTIAAEARAHLEAANKLFVPVNVVRSAELAVEFMEATVAAMDAAGLLPKEPEVQATEQPAA